MPISRVVHPAEKYSEAPETQLYSLVRDAFRLTQEADILKVAHDKATKDKEIAIEAAASRSADRPRPDLEEYSAFWGTVVLPTALEGQQAITEEKVRTLVGRIDEFFDKRHNEIVNVQCFDNKATIQEGATYIEEERPYVSETSGKLYAYRPSSYALVIEHTVTSTLKPDEDISYVAPLLDESGAVITRVVFEQPTAE